MSDPVNTSEGNCAAERSGKTGKKICCVCKPTKQVRDECIVLNGEERCKAFIDAHNQCLRDEGFDVAK
jgi:cytochrome c oxidase assembly protein subunit 17